MEFKDVAAVSGKPGLFKILKPTRTGVILESIDAAKNKVIIDSNSKVSILKDITVYTTGDDNIALSEIMIKMHESFKGALPVSSKNSDKELKDFLLKIVADYDTERVYASDIKKMLNWYVILHANYPELLVKGAEVPSAEVVEDDKTKKKATAGKAADGKAADGKKPAANKAKDIKVSTKTSAPPKKVTAARKAS